MVILESSSWKIHVDLVSLLDFAGMTVGLVLGLTGGPETMSDGDDARRRRRQTRRRQTRRCQLASIRGVVRCISGIPGQDQASHSLTVFMLSYANQALGPALCWAHSHEIIVRFPRCWTVSLKDVVVNDPFIKREDESRVQSRLVCDAWLNLNPSP